MNIFSNGQSLEVAVATQNQGKLLGVNQALEAFAARKFAAFTLHAVKTDSGVADTPLSDEEGVRGCANRLQDLVQKAPNMDLYIATEGVMSQIGNEWFVRGWTKAHHPASGRDATSCGAAVQIPSKLVLALNEGEQFSKTVKALYDVNTDEGVMVRDVGVNGIFSQGEYIRSNSFFDGLRICLAYLENDRNW